MDVLVKLKNPGEVLMLRNDTDKSITFKTYCGIEKEIVLNSNKTLFVIIGTVIFDGEDVSNRYMTFGSSLKTVARRASKQIANGDKDLELKLFNDMHNVYIKQYIIVNDPRSEIVVAAYPMSFENSQAGKSAFIDDFDTIMMYKQI